MFALVRYDQIKAFSTYSTPNAIDIGVDPILNNRLSTLRYDRVSEVLIDMTALSFFYVEIVDFDTFVLHAIDSPGSSFVPTAMTWDQRSDLYLDINRTLQLKTYSQKLDDAQTDRIGLVKNYALYYLTAGTDREYAVGKTIDTGLSPSQLDIMNNYTGLLRTSSNQTAFLQSGDFNFQIDDFNFFAQEGSQYFKTDAIVSEMQKFCEQNFNIITTPDEAISFFTVFSNWGNAVTDRKTDHILNINSLLTIDQVKNYNYLAGWPS